MTTHETFVYPDNEKRPTREDMPEGAYKYVYDGESRGVIVARMPTAPGHPELQHELSKRPFNPLLDDAGQFGLQWQETEEEMADRVQTWAKIYKDEGKPFDADGYLAQLRENFGQTRVTLDSEYGSSKLEYSPNPTTRSKFIERLQELFPEAHIILAKL